MKIKILGAIVILASLSCAVRQSSVTSQEEQKPRETPVRAGEIAPDFTLEDQQNRKVSLSEVRSRAPVMLVFYRGHW